MKKLWIIPVSLIFLLFAPPSHATPHDLLTNVSYSYEISLEFSYNHFQENHSYSGVGKGPHVSHYYYYPDYEPDLEDTTAELLAEVFPYEVHEFGKHLEMDQSIISVSGEWLFIPNYDNVIINLAGYAKADVFTAGGGEAEYAYSLFDYTDSLYIADESGFISYTMADEVDEDYLSSYEGHRLKIDHIYGLRLFGYSDASNYSGTQVSAKFSVPEPATLFLLGAAIAGLVGWRRIR